MRPSRRASSTSSGPSRPRPTPRSCSSPTTSGVIRTLCDRVGVMYAGKIVEEGDAASRLRAPAAPVHARASCGRCRATASASRSGRSSTIPGNLPQIGTDLPTCVFVDRCPLATDLCRTVEPPVVEVGAGRWTRCHHRDRLGELVEPPPVVGQDAVHGDLALSLVERLEDVPPERPRRAGAGQGRSRAASTARRSGWSANRARASRPWPRRSSGSRARTRAATIELDDARPRGPIGEPPDRRQAIDPDGLPEPGLGAQPRLDGASASSPARSAS